VDTSAATFRHSRSSTCRRADKFWDIQAAEWSYTIGGYQAIKKWLSYREEDLLGRGLKPEEVRYVTEMARRLTVLLSPGCSPDENNRRVSRTTYALPSKP